MKIPKPSDIEQFYKSQMISQIVNAEWRYKSFFSYQRDSQFLIIFSAHDIYTIKYRSQKSCRDKLSDDILHLFDQANCIQSLLVS